MKTKVWIEALRLRTLPLAVSSTILGSLLAVYYQVFRWRIAILSTLTAILLQILSNLANDLGDGLKGTDNDERIGPERAIQSGLISKKQMITAIIINIILALISGIWLIFEGIRVEHPVTLLAFVALGIGAIYSAIKYTVGNKPYGYAGFGDLFVFIWFGVVGVAGSFYLHGQYLEADIIFPGVSLGLLSVGVLNLNNLRDRISDTNSGKNTVVVQIGQRGGQIYQLLLVSLALATTIIFVIRNYSQVIQLLFLLPVPLLLIDARKVLTIRDPKLFDPFLKRFALETFFFSITLGVGFLMVNHAAG